MNFKIGDRVEVIAGNYPTTVKGSFGIISGNSYDDKEVAIIFSYIPNYHTDYNEHGPLAYIELKHLKHKPLSKLEKALK